MDARFEERLEKIRHLRDSFRSVPPDEEEVSDLEEVWAWAAVPGEEERLVLCTLLGVPTGVFAPRWLAHLLGMPHCTAHVALITPGDHIVLQRRSRTKAQFPDRWDLSVTGHVSLPAGVPLRAVSYLEAATRELAEEMGLPVEEHPRLLEAPGLTPLKTPVAYFAADEAGERPWYDVEVRQLYVATLTPLGLARLSYPEEEISGIYLCHPTEAFRLALNGECAAGVASSITDLATWFSQRQG